MKYGVAIFPTERSIRPMELGVALEERGFESLWVAEHSHIPACRSTPWPGGAQLPEMYYEVLDPFVALTAAAAVTTNLKVATGVCLVSQRDPIQTAKAVASLDQISGGRFLFGVGGGWNLEEMRNHGTDPKLRWKLMRERIEAMKAIWSEEKAEYHGELVDFPPVIARPKPAQEPHPPVHVGGRYPQGLRRAVRYGDGWIPLVGRGDDDIVKLMPEVGRALAEAGRSRASLEVTVYGVPVDPDLLKAYRDAGVTRVVLGLPPAPTEAVLPILDACQDLAVSVG